MKKIIIGLCLLVALIFLLYRNNRPLTPPNDNTGEMKSSDTAKTVTKVPVTHKVAKGEGLWQIAAKELGSGEKWGELADANGIKKPYILYVGQEIKIPGKETEVVTETSGSKKYTLAQVAEHDSKENCWLAIEGNVYDMTSYVKSGFHPGKDAILQGCGKDATVLFNTRPMGSGTSHSERARKMLPKYLIGTLEE